MNENKRIRTLPNSEVILKKNRSVNAKTVAAHKILERELNKIGIDSKTSYTLDPPLGSITRTSIFMTMLNDQSMNKD